MDFGLIIKYWPELWQSVVVTLELVVASLTLGTILALVVALGRLSSNRWISSIFTIYSLFIRATPILIVLYLSYYSLPQIGIFFEADFVAIAGLSIAASAYVGEIFRGGLQAIRPEQYQAARSLGISWTHTMRRIILPQAFRIILPPYMTQAVLIAKATSIAGIITVGELTGISYQFIAITYRPFEFLIFAAVVYLLMSTVISASRIYLERKWELRH